MSDATYVGRVWDFLEVGRQDLETLARVIESGDTAAIRSCSQELRLRADTLGLDEVAKCAGNLETGANNCCLAYTVVSYDCLRGKLNGLKEELARVP
jgi:hypothetical protein